MSLDLGALVGRVVLDSVQFDRTYVSVVRKMQQLGARAEESTRGTAALDKGLAGVAKSSTTTAAGLGRAAKAATEAGAAASKSAAAEDKAAQAAAAHATAVARVQSIVGKDTVAVLRQMAAQERLNTLMESGTATTRQLAGAQATAIAATNKLAASDDRLARAQQIVMSGTRRFAGALKGGLLAAGVAATVVAYESLKAAAAFQTSVTRIHTQAGASVRDTQAMAAGMLKMAASVGTLPTALADAGFHISSANQGILSLSKQLGVLRLAAEGAKLGGSDLVDTTNALDAAVVSGIGGVKNFNQAMGALNATVGSGDMTMQNLAEALGTGVLAVIKGYGVNLRQAGAALATFGDNNIRGAMAGTQLRMAVQSLTVPSSHAAAALAQLGLTGKNAFTHFAKDLQTGGLTKALGDIHARLIASGVGFKGWGEILTQAFTKRAGAGINVLLQQFARYQKKLQEVGAASGRFAGDWKSYTKTFGFAKDQFKAAADTLGVELGNKLLPTATRVLRWLGTSGAAEARKLGNELAPLGHFIADTLWPALRKLGGQVIGGVISAFHSLAGTVHNNADGLKLIAGVLGGVVLKTLGFVLPNAIKTVAALLGILVVIVGQVGKAFLHLKDFLTGPFVRAIGTMASFWLRATKDMLDVFLSVTGSIIHAAASMLGWVPGIGGKLKSAAAAFDRFRGSVDTTLSAAAASAGHWGAVAAGNWNRGWNAGLANRSANAAEYAGAASGAKPRSGKYETTAQAARIAAQASGQAAGAAFTGGTADGITAGTPGVSSAATKMANAAVDAAKSVFDSAKSRLAADLGVRSQEASSVMSNQLAGLDLSNAVINGRAGNISAFLRAESIPVRRLHKDERLLRDAGLSPKLLQQIADTDPTTGLTIAQNILAGKSGSIAHIDQLVAQARFYAKATGGIVAHSLYDNRIARDRQDVHNSYLELKKLNANMTGLRQDLKGHPRQTGHEVAGALDHALGGGHHKALSRTSH